MTQQPTQQPMQFEIFPNGDPHGKGWMVREKVGTSWFYRGDLSPMVGKQRAIAHLKRRYPGCQVKVAKR